MMRRSKMWAGLSLCGCNIRSSSPQQSPPPSPRKCEVCQVIIDGERWCRKHSYMETNIEAEKRYSPLLSESDISPFLREIYSYLKEEEISSSTTLMCTPQMPYWYNVSSLSKKFTELTPRKYSKYWFREKEYTLVYCDDSVRYLYSGDNSKIFLLKNEESEKVTTLFVYNNFRDKESIFNFCSKVELAYFFDYGKFDSFICDDEEITYCFSGTSIVGYRITDRELNFEDIESRERIFSRKNYKNTRVLLRNGILYECLPNTNLPIVTLEVFGNYVGEYFVNYGCIRTKFKSFLGIELCRMKNPSKFLLFEEALIIERVSTFLKESNTGGDTPFVLDNILFEETLRVYRLQQ